MCQLCPITKTATANRWPKPLETSTKDLNFLIETAHTEYENTKRSISTTDRSTLPESLLDVLRLINTAIEELEKEREKWWMAPEKKELRRRLEADCDQKRLTALQKINNKTAEMIEGMQAKLGTFVKWALGMNGGIWELVAGEKVEKGNDKENLVPTVDEEL